MPKALLSSLATSDLEEIFDFIAQDNLDAARTFTGLVVKTFDVLANNPEIGKPQPDIDLGVRSFSVRGYVIFYYQIEDGVQIYRVLHGARDIEAQFDEAA